MRTKIFVSSFGLLAMAAVLALVGALGVAPDSEARPPAACVGSYQSPEDWGHGETCNDASGDLYNNLWDYAVSFCGPLSNPCNASLVLTLDCHPNSMGGTGMELDGYLLFGCDDGLM